MSVGLTVTQRRYVKYGDGHYGGNLVYGAYVLALFGDVATEACIRMDGDEGLFASYSDVQFRAPVLAGTSSRPRRRSPQSGGAAGGSRSRPAWCAGPNPKAWRAASRPPRCSASRSSSSPRPAPWWSRWQPLAEGAEPGETRLSPA